MGETPSLIDNNIFISSFFLITVTVFFSFINRFFSTKSFFRANKLVLLLGTTAGAVWLHSLLSSDTPSSCLATTMEVKMKGWPQATALYLTVILCFLAGPLNAGPLQGNHRTKGHVSVVSNWRHTPTSHHGYHGPTLSASKEVAAHPSHDMVSSLASVNHVSALGRRDGDDDGEDKAHHNWALVCDNREWTTMCQGSGYYCTSSGKLKNKGRDLLCSMICTCENLVPAPKPCVINNKGSKACAVANNLVLDATTGEIIGNVSDASILPNGAMDFTTAIARRDTELSHDYALVCHDRVLTGLCQSSEHSYFCNGLRTVNHKGQAEIACETHCTCVNIAPKPCLLGGVVPVACGFKDGMVFDTIDGTVIGNLTDAQVLGNGSLSFPQTNALVKRHDYGLVCYDRENTAWCGSTYEYYCTARGALVSNSAGDYWCEHNCDCINLKPQIACFPNAALLTSCLLKGKMVYADNGTLLGNVSDAYVYANGTLDFRKAVTRDLTMVSSDSNQIICKTQQSSQVSPFDGGLVYDKNLTTFCATHGYFCASDPARARLDLTLQPGSKDITECDAGCECPTETWKRQAIEQELSQPSPTPIGVTIQDLLLGCSSNDGLTQDSWSFNETLTEYCKSHGYDCAIEPGPVYVLQHPKNAVDVCQVGCACPPSPRRLLSARANAEPRADDMGTVPTTNSFDPFGMTCSLSRSRSNESFTRHCQQEGYSCVTMMGTVLRTLSHNGTENHECTHNCQCRNPFGLDDRSGQVGMSVTEDETPDSTAVAPPSGVPSQSSSPFALNCGNVADGPGFCQSSDLGYFCGYNMTVMRTTTVQNQGVTWCDYYCSCIFKNPVACVNEWNVPFCREMPDGTVRDASNMQVVLAYIQDVVILPNNSILLDRGQDGGFPFVAAMHGAQEPGRNDSSSDSGDSPRWTDWPMNGTANSWWNRTGRADD
ncbi:hypothetical protein AYL99_02959 [Fonsecaea erecta]|uniref:Uncharacterized protein n=1 Tax=Fonsecaea erecta TaxID=1367422 RepID=A0A178ZVK2_9EURO|nr:hypothetical protein AYL99_02959 [Fonsecaea erecta]OAP63732.1 hypothetical protein AYL99_02959 [Fonsecaea erecta]